ncbi:LacI family DNA-binding transcriptional regulator [Microbacterium rhizosphaerae]
MTMRRAATIEDVAQAAGVSRQTVSNVLNAPDIVREATRERVRAAITALGYAPHASARRLRLQRSSTIGIHLDPYAGGISGVVLDRFVHALTEQAGERRQRVLVYAARSPEDEIARMAELADGGEIDAVVITGTFHGDPRTVWLAERDLPFVSFGRPWGVDDIDDPAHLWVDVDGAAGTRAATEYAMGQVGPRVAFLGWPGGSGTGDDRERGWLEARGGLPPAPRLTAVESVAEGRAAAAAALASREFDALVCASDVLAIGAHLAATDAGADMPVIGFDNTPAAEALGISSVEQLPEKVAEGVLELLMGERTAISPRSASPGHAHVLVEPRLVVRRPAA